VPAPSDLLDRFPRVALGHWPTPLEPADRLRAEIGGPRVWLKRDDCSGLAFGGNKTRKLEFLLGRAAADGATRIVTFGALQSNHARQTAAGCARLGLGCDLVVHRAVRRDDPHYAASGNLLLDRLFGATVHVVDNAVAGVERADELRAAAEAAGERLAVIPLGGSDATGVLGYVDATFELAAQLAAADLAARRIVVAASTVGTAAGIVLGAELAGLDVTVDAVCVASPATATGPQLQRLVMEGAGLIGCHVPDADRWSVTDRTLGPGYGAVTAEVRATIELLARTEGVLLDPVYTGKAFADLARRILDGALDPADDVVFIHTGGTPALFAYAPEWA
jgi:D-cysteine desulfhydrase family pyridoxal phosphate-dependent enzyme